MPRSGSSSAASQRQQVFSGPLRQHGAGFGALAAGIGRVAIPLITRYVIPAAKRYAIPAVKKVGRDFIRAALPELSAVLQGKKRGRTALKSVLKTTARKQLGGGGAPRRRRRPTGGGGVKKRKSTAAGTAAAKKRKKTKTKTKTKKRTTSCKAKRGKTQRRRSRAPPSSISRHDFFSSIDGSARV